MTIHENMKQALEVYLSREMPAGTVIGDPKWWAIRIANVASRVVADEPLTFPHEAACFKQWFDAWWLGDGERGDSIPSQSDSKFADYIGQYTLGFGAWMAAKHAARGIEGRPFAQM